MASQTTRKGRRLTELSGDELSNLLDLMRGADTVELKVTLPESAHRSAIAALGLDPLEAQVRQVYFFDTPELTLNQAGVVARARRVAGRGGDTVVKLRPVVPDQLPDDLRRSGSIGIEVDAMPGGFVCSASMKGKADNTDVREAAIGPRPLRKLFSREQRTFFSRHAPEGLELSQLAVLGPTFVLKQNTRPPELGRKLAAELWLIPDGSRVFELSAKCSPGEAYQVAMETRAYLEGLGLDLSADPQTKTKTTLEFFSGELREQETEAESPMGRGLCPPVDRCAAAMLGSSPLANTP
jgi:hypothetical protein